MNEIPAWWMYVSGAFFVVNLIFFCVLIYLAFFMIGWMKEMKPKIDSLSTRVDSIGKNVEELTQHVKTTAEAVGGKAQHVASSVESIAQLASMTFERFTPYVAGGLAAMKLLSGFMAMRRTMAPEKGQMALEDGHKGKRRKS